MGSNSGRKKQLSTSNLESLGPEIIQNMHTPYGDQVSQT